MDGTPVTTHRFGPNTLSRTSLVFEVSAMAMENGSRTNNITSSLPRRRSAIKPPPVLPLVSEAEGRGRKAEGRSRNSTQRRKGAETHPKKF